MSDYYVYALLDPRTPESFPCPGTRKVLTHTPRYIGKGRGSRVVASAKEMQHDNMKGRWLRRLSREDLEPIVVMLKTSMQETASFDLERRLIAHIGRHELGTGPLLNRSQGGEGGTHFTDKEKRLYVKLLAGSGFSLVGELFGYNGYAEHKCKVHGLVSTAPCHVLKRMEKNAPLCPRCGETARGPQIRAHRLTNGEGSYRELFATLDPKKFKLIGQYSGAVKLTKHWCSTHGNFMVTPSNVRQKMSQGLTPCGECNWSTKCARSRL